ncbi:MAG TPA: (2Fe-2S) ferredoxin domain-containing protein [Petrotogaceae bacterium]|jgi:NADP-reducing hydrogenase subunit HndB|nr:(2Fe-2S) ferredoxin domain-containing protein [Petrotogaceae bacterium]HQF33516.1 (2Fe-2S) ferredoxin domain-containing protein [Petrotogaceae bacterium]HQH32667.1 (2Fe-2S) ferredoxin domain-containing protein [Petrotogaceae bacterium]HQI79134.1 (2Fe-2S) ferredoxin domain-containing protein [Petrotogaceae bacterium]
MPIVKSVADLMKIKEQAKEKIQVRKTADSESKIVLKVAMGTCGIASGAKETFSALIEEIDKRKMNNIVVVQTGCMGYCHSEPTIEVIEPGKDSIIYGKMTKDRAGELIQKHIIDGELLQDSIIGKTHQVAK